MSVDPNVELLGRMAILLGDLCERLVLVGGCATGLLITDRAAPPVRMTSDVDVTVAVTSLAEYYELGNLLRDRGFLQSMAAGDPPYRWIQAGQRLDLIPADSDLLGFSNRWYELAIRTARRVELPNGASMRLISAPCFVATKLEAFRDRGSGDYFMSHDLEDILSILDGRPELVQEFSAADRALTSFVATEFASMVGDDDFLNALPGLIAEGSPQSRSTIVLDRMREIIRIGTSG